MEDPSGPHIARREHAAHQMEVQDMRDAVEAAEKAEVRELVTTMLIQLPLVMSMLAGMATSPRNIFFVVLVGLPLEVFLFRRLGKAGDEVKRLKGLLAKLLGEGDEAHT